MGKGEAKQAGKYLNIRTTMSPSLGSIIYFHEDKQILFHISTLPNPIHSSYETG
jgi:hypothetical protein